ncbi:MAG: hypothetical protein RSB61_03500 [Clostridia bacterium]
MASIKNLITKIELDRDLSPDGRDIEQRGRFRQTLSLFGKNMSKMTLANIFVALFAMPLLILFFMYLPNQEKLKIAAESLNFSGGLGIGYGVVDGTFRGIDLIYSLRQKFVLMFLTPCAMLISIGMAGAYYVCRNALWGAKVNFFRHFFRGIAKHWWKFLIAFTYIGLLSTGFVYSLLEVLKQSAIVGSAGVGIWFALVLSGILLLLSCMFLMIYFPMTVSYKFNLKNTIKNSSIVLIVGFVMSLIVIIGMALPMALVFAGFFKYIIYVFVLMMGLSLYIMCDLAFSQFLCDNFIIATFDEQTKAKQREAEKLARMEKHKEKTQKANASNGKRRR